MSEFVKNVYRERTDFARIKSNFPIPDLLEVQKNSYERFLQTGIKAEDREEIGLKSVLKSVFPITDFKDTCSLEFVEYEIGNPKYTIEECKERGMTYAAPLKVVIRLLVWDKDEKTEEKTIRDVKEQEVYFGDLPLMTEKGEFIINGTERVIVSQLHRSPGVFFESNSQRNYFLGKIIPYRGSWIEFEYDSKKNILYVRIDRKRKYPATTFLRALSFGDAEASKAATATEFPQISDADIIRDYYSASRIVVKGNSLYRIVSEQLIGFRLSKDITDPGDDQIVLIPAGRKVTNKAFSNLKKAGIEKIEVTEEDLEGARFVDQVVNPDTGEIIAESTNEITPGTVQELCTLSNLEFEVIFPEKDPVGMTILNTLAKDSMNTSKEALIEIYKKQRPGDPPTLETSKALFLGMFFDARKYDFSKVGRLKFNIKMGTDISLDHRTLSASDFREVVKYLLKLQNGIGSVDDIDHLGNRRVRAVGELLENQFRIGLVRMERAIKEKMSVHQEIATAMPHDLINAKPVMASIREFFGSSQLSQFMDQTNPLAEITHKRRLSALGPGGLSRERAGFEVRDVHPSHYGRICPIETPEGPNIGLISSLSCYARIDEFGFIESPSRKVIDGRVVDYCKVLDPGNTSLKPGEVCTLEEMEAANKKKKRAATYEPYPFYLTAWEGDKHYIAQANIELDENLRIVHDRVNARYEGETIYTAKEKIEYVDISPKLLVSVAASMIPFLENDDANRALMGSNMQRQAVPLLNAQAPFVGTGMEYIAAKDSGAVIICRRDGVVESVDGERILIRASAGEGSTVRDAGVDIYKLIRFERSNQNTCMTQKPLVRKGDPVHRGQVLADGPCTENGELALGRNVLVAFMPWRGYNFEDAILISEKLVKEDSFTSIHIEELEIEARDTKLGPEEITRDIPNVSESILADLDESGIIRIGASIKPHDIIVGKVTPKGETQLTPEEKLLRAIFGEKAGEVKDASLYAPPGIEGTVVNVKVFTRRGVDKDLRTLQIEADEIQRLQRDLKDEISIIKSECRERMLALLDGQKSSEALKEGKKTLVKSGETISAQALEQMTIEQLISVSIGDVKVQGEIHSIGEKSSQQIDYLKTNLEDRIERIEKGDELPPGVIKMVKVFVAMKRKISVGDKMAGRHGNKGVISRILPEEDMPFLPDGTPVEIVLNPLGVPSRMNVGQVLETHLGWAAKVLGLHYATPVFDGASEWDVLLELEKAGLPQTGKIKLIDGTTGDHFLQEVTVGYIYMNKLSHMVDDKIHARSIGPYSLITQQPLGGKAQFGGQRFGEMEVWALEAYGAANVLQELLTAKSDDVQGRAKIYESIVKGESTYSPGIPESFNVLIRELQSLALDVELMEKPKKRLRRKSDALEEAEAVFAGVSAELAETDEGKVSEE